MANVDERTAEVLERFVGNGDDQDQELRRALWFISVHAHKKGDASGDLQDLQPAPLDVIRAIHADCERLLSPERLMAQPGDHVTDCQRVYEKERAEDAAYWERFNKDRAAQN